MSYKRAVVIHVQYADSTRPTMVCPGWFWPWAIGTISMVLQSTFPHCWIATPKDHWWRTSRTKCRKAKKRQSRYRQHDCNSQVENTTKETNGEGYRTYNPNATTCITNRIKEPFSQVAEKKENQKFVLKESLKIISPHHMAHLSKKQQEIKEGRRTLINQYLHIKKSINTMTMLTTNRSRHRLHQQGLLSVFTAFCVVIAPHQPHLKPVSLGETRTRSPQPQQVVSTSSLTDSEWLFPCISIQVAT